MESEEIIGFPAQTALGVGRMGFLACANFSLSPATLPAYAPEVTARAIPLFSKRNDNSIMYAELPRPAGLSVCSRRA